MSCVLRRLEYLNHLNDVSCLVLSQPNPKRLGSSRVLTSVSWQMSLSRKNVWTPSPHISQCMQLAFISCMHLEVNERGCN